MKNNKLKQWLGERLNLRALKEMLLLEPIPGGAKIAYVFGSALLFVFVLQIVTGIFLMFYYAPTVDHAWESIRYIMEDVEFGFLVRGIHHWASSAMVILVLVHLLQVFIWGAYKKPRELVWLMGVVLLILVLGAGFTGYLLPWDQKAYWASVVGIQIASIAPVLGDFMGKFLKGGDVVGVLTLNRFYVIHVMIIPFSIMVLAALHLIFFRNAGPAGPYEGEPDELEKKKDFFYPKQVFIDMAFSFAVFLIIVGLAVFNPPELFIKANPSVSAFNPAPEWYFLFLFQLLKLPIFAGNIGELFGAFIIPSLFIALLFALPFIDRNPSRSPLKRPLAMASVSIIMAGIILLTAIAMNSAPKLAKANPKLAKQGLTIYYTTGNCASCHKIDILDEKVLGSAGQQVGPNLTDQADRGRSIDWLVKHFEDPMSISPESIMPSADMVGLTKEDVLALAHFMTIPIKDIPDKELPELLKKVNE
jgi:ubiquinol-cytochrome c reductase cytochrome b subunit